MKKHIIIRGPLGIGKSTIANKVAEQLNTQYISVDAVLEDHKLISPDTDGISSETFIKANEIIVSACTGSCVIDGNFYYQEQIDDLATRLDENVTIITLLADVETCIERDAAREKAYGEDSVRYVYMITTAVQGGVEVQTDGLSIEETVKRVMELV